MFSMQYFALSNLTHTYNILMQTTNLRLTLRNLILRCTCQNEDISKQECSSLDLKYAIKIIFLIYTITINFLSIYTIKLSFTLI